jgi:hypothetical protein
MTTEAMVPKKSLPLWLKLIKKVPGIRVLARVLEPLPDAGINLVGFLLFAAVLGGVLIWVSPYVFNAPEVIGRIAASWCVERGSCDLTTNVVSIGLGLYLAAVIFLVLSFSINMGSAESTQSIYYDVRGELERAGPAGIRPIDIAKRTGHDLTDVHTMLGYLYDDARAEIVEADQTGRRVKYRLAKDKDE